MKLKNNLFIIKFGKNSNEIFVIKVILFINYYYDLKIIKSRKSL